MQITTLSEAELADDAILHEHYAVERRAHLEGRADMPFWTLQDYVGGLRTPDPGERQLVYAVRDGDRLVGTAAVWLPIVDNTEKAWGELYVDPPARGRGVGTALVERIEQDVRAEGRTLLLVVSTLPFEGREEHDHARFARARGFELSNYEVARHLTVPVPDEVIQGWLDEAAPRHDGYRIETFVNHLPAELVDGVCLLAGQLAVDAPTGAVDFEEELVTPERYAGLVETTNAMGRDRFETLALTPDGVVAAQSTLAVPREGTEIHQWGTFVHREHRGHRLGLATKAANLRAAQAACPGARLVTTQNAETNRYMVAINERMGFRAVEVEAEFVKRF